MFAEHEDAVTHEYATETSALLRVGAGWDFHFGRLTATPSMYYDVVKGHRAVVYGVALGRGSSSTPRRPEPAGRSYRTCDLTEEENITRRVKSA